MVNIGNDWDEILAGEFDKEYYKNLREFLVSEYRSRTIYPDMYDIFNALKAAPYKDAKVVILGQDPYHEPGQAHGLCFSVKKGVEIPPSLKNIYKELEDDKSYWLDKENTGTFYTAALGEEAVIPEYDYSEVAGKIAEIDEKVAKLRHAINLANATSLVKVDDAEMTVDTLLIKMAQASRRKAFLDNLRKQQEKTRTHNYSYVNKQSVPEYKYINYDLELVKSEFEKISDYIMKMQMALDYYNQTAEFEAEL